jgi:CelD/BcsL family acetyltransferase involved in cellulose biosynthesis
MKNLRLRLVRVTRRNASELLVSPCPTDGSIFGLKAKLMVIHPVEFWFSLGGSLCLRTVKLNALVVNTVRGASPAALVPTLPAEVDVVYATEAAPERPGRAIVRHPQALRYAILPAYRRYYVDIVGSFDTYLSKFSSKTRQTWRRKLTKLEKASGGPVCWRTFKRAEEMRAFHRFACEVAKTTYQQKLYNSGILDTPAFRDQLRRNANADLVRGYVMFLNQRPIAYSYCYAIDDVLVSSKIGFNPEFAHLSPGTVLFHLVLEDLFRHDRFRRFDFGRGEFPYKEHYASAEQRCIDTFYFPRTTGNAAFAAAHLGTVLLSRSVSRSLAAIGMKDAAKQALRDFAARRRGVIRPAPLDEDGGT